MTELCQDNCSFVCGLVVSALLFLPLLFAKPKIDMHVVLVVSAACFAALLTDSALHGAVPFVRTLGLGLVGFLLGYLFHWLRETSE